MNADAPGIIISDPVLATLDRMRCIDAVIHRYDDYMDGTDPMFGEYRELQEEMVDLFLPLMEKIIQAGLLSLHIDLEGEDLTDFRSVTGDPDSAFCNGNIQIDAKYSGGCLKPESERDRRVEAALEGKQ